MMIRNIVHRPVDIDVDIGERNSSGDCDMGGNQREDDDTGAPTNIGEKHVDVELTKIMEGPLTGAPSAAATGRKAGLKYFCPIYDMIRLLFQIGENRYRGIVQNVADKCTCLHKMTIRE